MPPGLEGRLSALSKLTLQVGVEALRGVKVDRARTATIVANIALAMHIAHGAWSMFQSLGWNNPRWNPARRWFAYGFAAVILVGNLSIPIAILSGAVKA